MWAGARAAVVFLAVMILGGGVLLNERVESAALRPFTGVVTRLSAATLRAVGVPARTDEQHLVSPDDRVRLYVGVDCSGVWAHLVLLAAVLASPATLRQKLLGLALGEPVLFAANIVRVASLFVIATKMPTFLHTAHVYVWQLLIIGIALAIHSLWIETLVDAKS